MRLGTCPPTSPRFAKSTSSSPASIIATLHRSKVRTNKNNFALWFLVKSCQFVYLTWFTKSNNCSESADSTGLGDLFRHIHFQIKGLRIFAQTTPPQALQQLLTITWWVWSLSRAWCRRWTFLSIIFVLKNRYLPYNYIYIHSTSDHFPANLPKKQKQQKTSHGDFYKSSNSPPRRFFSTAPWCTSGLKLCTSFRKPSINAVRKAAGAGSFNLDFWWEFQGYPKLNIWGVPKTVGFPPKSSILIIGFSVMNHPFWGTPIFGNTHIELILE